MMPTSYLFDLPKEDNLNKLTLKKDIGPCFVRYLFLIFLIFLFLSFPSRASAKVWKITGVNKKYVTLNGGSFDGLDRAVRLWVYRIQNNKKPFLIDLLAVTDCHDLTSRTRQRLELTNLTNSDRAKRAVYNPEPDVSSDYYFAEAEDLFFEGRFERGFEQLLLCLETKKDHASALVMVSLYQIRNGLFRDALKNLIRSGKSRQFKSEIKENDYYYLFMHVLKGVCFLEARKHGNAIRSLDYAIELSESASASDAIKRAGHIARALKIMCLRTDGYIGYADLEQSRLSKSLDFKSDLNIILKHNGFVKRLFESYFD